ncbi:hypothetical protein Tco_1232780 [Tanacetum coccineum]
MDMYHSRLTQDDINDLVIKYKIPCDLHPRLPLEEFVMSELPDDAIDRTDVCIDDNRSCMKHWKNGFFLINRWAISDYMVWRHPSATIDDPRPVAGSFIMADARRLSAHVIKQRDMPEGVLVLSGLSRVWKSHVCDQVLRGADGNVMGIHDFLCLPKWTDVEVQKEPHLDLRPTLQRLPFYCTLSAATDAVIPYLTPENLTSGTPSAKILAKAEASQKQKAFTSGATSSHVAKRTSDDDDDDDACVEILLVTPFRSTTVIPSSGNQGRSSAAPVAKGPNTRDSQGMGIMADDAVAPSVGVSRPRPSSGPAPSFRDVYGDAIHANLFPFSAGLYYATYSEGGVAGNCKFTCEEMSVLHYMMMSHGGELLARYRGLNQSHHEYVLSADSRLKGYEEKVVSLTGLELQVSTLKNQVSGLNDKLSSSDASFAKSKAKGKERKKKIKYLTKSLDNLHAEVARLSAALNQATVLEAEKDEETLRLKATPPKFASFFRGQFQGLVQKFLASDEFSRVQGELIVWLPVLGRLAEVSPLVAQTDYAFLNKISKHVAEPLSIILQLEPEKLARPDNVPASRDARVSPPIAKESTMTLAFESLELPTNVAPTSSTVASGQNEDDCGTADVVVAFSVGEKGDGSLLSFAADEKDATNPSGFRLRQTDCRCVVVHPADPELCHLP